MNTRRIRATLISNANRAAIQFRLTEMWLIALCPEQELGHRLSPAARAHIEQVLGDEYRMQANLIREELRHAEAA